MADESPRPRTVTVATSALKPKAYGTRPTSPARLRELQRTYEQAEAGFAPLNLSSSALLLRTTTGLVPSDDPASLIASLSAGGPAAQTLVSGEF